MKHMLSNNSVRDKNLEKFPMNVYCGTYWYF